MQTTFVEELDEAAVQDIVSDAGMLFTGPLHLNQLMSYSRSILLRDYHTDKLLNLQVTILNIIEHPKDERWCYQRLVAKPLIKGRDHWVECGFLMNRP